MSNIAIYLTFRILPALLALAFAFYLANIIFNQNKREALLHKHKKGSSGYRLYQKIYSPQFLLIWMLFTVSAIARITLDYYKSIQGLVSSVGFVLSLVVPAVALYLLYKLFREK